MMHGSFPSTAARIFRPQSVNGWVIPAGTGKVRLSVVDTTNFTNKSKFRGADENLHLTERFTKINSDTLLYEFTVDDPTVFTKPWKGEVPMTASRPAL
jgi:hypothetical protein